MVHRIAGSRLRVWLLPAALILLSGTNVLAAQAQLTTGQGIAQLEAQQQRREGQIFYADGDVDIRYGAMRIQADHVEYNSATYEATASGHVQFDFDTLQIQCDSAEVNLRTGRGHFEHVSGTERILREPNSAVLVTPNPLSFRADSVDRIDENTYKVHHAWLTVCEPDKPTWSFSASEATLHEDHEVALVNANFRMFRIPLFYFPYASVPAAKRVRHSGFLIPTIGNSAAKGLMVGDAYYWAPTDWADATIGAEYLSRRGWSQTGSFEILPTDNIKLSANYYGLEDRLGQGGTTAGLKFDAEFANGWRAVADLNELTSYVFRLAFAPTFSDATNSEVHSTAFVNNNFDGFSVSFSGSNYENFLTATPQTEEIIRQAPQARFHAVDQQPWKRLPIYFGADVFADAAYRSDTQIATPPMVQRTEIAPNVTIPLVMGPWLTLTPTFTLRSLRYGAQEQAGVVVDSPITRTTEELELDLRPAAIERTWGKANSKWKHTIEPALVYRYVTGVNDFNDFLHFDEEDTLTDTNELEYSITQRLFHRGATGTGDEFLSWKVVQKYYFDPTFGGALVPGQRNVFEALDSLTPFAFADEPRHFSPIVSDIKLSPTARYDAELRVDYDPNRQKLTSHELLGTLRATDMLQVGVASYAVDASSVLQPMSNQIRGTISYGDFNRPGWNMSFSTGYDLRERLWQTQVVQVSYNGSCCGISFQYQRLTLGPVQRGNEFRAALVIANLGVFGDLQKRQPLY